TRLEIKPKYIFAQLLV
ncbi:mCG1050262, partial [Mus musculus]